jgi:hypothetical protein
MATRRPVLAALGAVTLLLAMGVQGCASPTTYQRHQPPTFAQAAPTVTTESWATVLPLPGVQQDRLAYARRDTALGLPPPGYATVAGSWEASDRPSLDRYRFIPLSRSPHHLLYFGTPAQYERRTPWIPRRADPWRTAW